MGTLIIGILSFLLMITSSNGGYCRDDWKEFSGDCYHAYTGPITWQDAVVRCGNEGANLTSIVDKQEMDFIFSIIDIAKNDYWISLTNASNRWRWTDGSDLWYDKWNSGEPDGSGGCGRIASTNWRDTPCSSSYSSEASHDIGFICRKAISENVALKKQASQTGIREGMDASKAVDGRLDSDQYGQIDYYKEVCAGPDTGSTDVARWSVDLGKTYIVDTIKLQNTFNKYGSNQMHDFKIEVVTQTNQKHLCSEERLVSLGVTLTVRCDGAYGNYVNITKLLDYGGSDQMTICEVQVYGQPVQENNFQHGNVALNKPTLQSGIEGTWYARQAVDGIIDRDMPGFYQGVCASPDTGSNNTVAQWSVELEGTYLIHDVLLHNTFDQSRYKQMNNFKIEIETQHNQRKLCSMFINSEPVPRGRSVSIDCKGVAGHSVFLTKLPGYEDSHRITICEVEVDGVRMPATSSYPESTTQPVEVPTITLKVNTRTTTTPKVNTRTTTTPKVNTRTTTTPKVNTKTPPTAARGSSTLSGAVYDQPIMIVFIVCTVILFILMVLNCLIGQAALYECALTMCCYSDGYKKLPDVANSTDKHQKAAEPPAPSKNATQDENIMETSLNRGFMKNENIMETSLNRGFMKKYRESARNVQPRVTEQPREPQYDYGKGYGYYGSPIDAEQ